MDNRVWLVKGSDKRELVRQVINFMGEEFKKKVLSSRKILLHPNLVSSDNQSATTNVELLRGVVDHISLLTDREIIVADASYHDTKKAFQNFGYLSLERSGNVKLIDLNDDQVVETFAYDENLGKKEIGFSKLVATSDLNIVAVPAKMHSYYSVSLSLKTHVVGSMVVSKSPFGIHVRWPWLHTGFKSAHKTLADVYQKFPAQLAIIDGTSAMEGNGPASGQEVNLGWVLASFNPVTADALASYLMGWEVKDLGYLYFLNQKGLGPASLEELKVLGEDPKKLRKEIKKPDTYPEILSWK